MQHGFDVHGPVALGPAPQLDAERLDVYRVALEFHALVASLDAMPGRREIRDQLDRAALSIVLNTAEGAGRSGLADKARFYSMARGSAMECAAVLDVMRATALVPPAIHARGRSLLIRIVQMHTRLCQKLTRR
jgi:four helix bundle protein